MNKIVMWIIGLVVAVGALLALSPLARRQQHKKVRTTYAGFINTSFFRMDNNYQTQPCCDLDEDVEFEFMLEEVEDATTW